MNTKQHKTQITLRHVWEFFSGLLMGALFILFIVAFLRVVESTPVDLNQTSNISPACFTVNDEGYARMDEGLCGRD